MSAVTEGDRVAVGIPFRHAHAGRDAIIPHRDSVESGPPPVWLIESVANVLLVHGGVEDGVHWRRELCLRRSKLPLLSTSFAVKSQIGPGRGDGDVLDARRYGLAPAGQADEVEVGGAWEIDDDRRDRAAGGERYAAAIDRASRHQPHTWDGSGCALERPSPCRVRAGCISVMVKLSLKLSPVMVRGLLGVGIGDRHVAENRAVLQASRFIIRRRLLVARCTELRPFGKRRESQVMFVAPESGCTAIVTTRRLVSTKEQAWIGGRSKSSTHANTASRSNQTSTAWAAGRRLPRSIIPPT